VEASRQSIRPRRCSCAGGGPHLRTPPVIFTQRRGPTLRAEGVSRGPCGDAGVGDDDGGRRRVHADSMEAASVTSTERLARLHAGGSSGCSPGRSASQTSQPKFQKAHGGESDSLAPPVPPAVPSGLYAQKLCKRLRWEGAFSCKTRILRATKSSTVKTGIRERAQDPHAQQDLLPLQPLAHLEFLSTS